MIYEWLIGPDEVVDRFKLQNEWKKSHLKVSYFNNLKTTKGIKKLNGKSHALLVIQSTARQKCADVFTVKNI